MADLITPPVAPPVAPPALDIDALLADETKGDTALKVSDLKPFLEQHTNRLVEQVTTDLRTRQEQAEAARRDAEERNASAKTDRDFARGIEQRLRSADEAERAQAQIDMDASKDRYRRGLAIDWQMESAETRDRAIAEHTTPLLADLQKQGQQAYLDALANPAEVAKFGGNYLLMAIKHGEEIGYQRGKTEAADLADQGRRIDAGASGAPSLGAPAGNNGGDRYAGIDQSKPGAAAEMMKRDADARSRAGSRR